MSGMVDVCEGFAVLLVNIRTLKAGEQGGLFVAVGQHWLMQSALRAR